MIIIKIIESLEKSVLLIDGVTETVKQKIKKQEGGFFGGYGCTKNIGELNWMSHSVSFCSFL